MAFLSDRIVVNASITIGTAAGQVVGYVPNASGAKAVLLRISGGTNSANNIVSATLRGVPNQKLGATAAANTFPALSLLNGVYGKTNATADATPPLMFALPLADATVTAAAAFFPFPFPAIQVVIQMATAPSSGCLVEAYLLFETDPRSTSSDMSA